MSTDPNEVEPPEMSHEEAEAELYEVASLFSPYVDGEFKLGLGLPKSKASLGRILGRVASSSGFSVREIRTRLRKAQNVPNCLTSLTPATARLLVRYYDWLDLNRVGQLDDECAEILSGLQAIELNLHGLKQISTYQIKCLAQSAAGLGLGGLKRISQPDAVALGQAFNGLDLSGLESISPQAAGQVIRNKSSLALTGLSSLNPEIIAALRENANWENVWLSLGTGTRLGLDNARELARWPYDLDLYGFEALSLQEATALADSHATLLRFDTLKDLPPDQALALARFKGEQLAFWELSEISDESFQGLMRGKAYLQFKKLAALSDEQARLLQFYPHTVVLDGLQELTETQARHLLARSEKVYVSKKIRIPETLREYLSPQAKSPFEFLSWD